MTRSSAPDPIADLTVRPTPLADLGGVPLLVTAGEATLFLVDDARGGIRTPVATLAVPSLVVPGPPPAGRRWVLGSGLGTRVEELDLARDDELLRTAAADTALRLSEPVRDALGQTTARVVRLTGRSQQVEAGAGAAVEEVAWVSATSGSVSLGGRPLPEGGAPLAPRLVVRADRDAQLRCGPFAEPTTADLVDGLTWLFSLAGDVVAQAQSARLDEDASLARHAAARSSVAEHRGVALLARELRGEPASLVPEDAEPIVTVAARVLGASGHSLALPTSGLGDLEGVDAVRAIASASGVFPRRVTLQGRWWHRPVEPMLGFEPDGTPVALLPDGAGVVHAYAARPGDPYDPLATSGVVVTPDNAAGLLDTAFTFSRPLVDGHVDVRSLARVAARGRRRDLAAYVGWAAVLATAGLAVPFASGVVFDQIVPRGNRDRLWYLLLCLVLVALATVPVQIALASVRTRLETGAGFDVERGVWGRVLRSRVALVRRLGAGDVTTRLAALEASRDVVDRSILAVLPAVLSGLVAGLVLFTYDAELAVLVLIFGLFMTVLTTLLAWQTSRAQTRVDEASGAVNGFLFQVFVAIPKIRVAGAEPRAFLAWATRFAPAVGRRMTEISARQLLVTAMMPTLGTLALITSAALVGPSGIQVGIFIAFQTTYSLFVSGVIATAGATSAVLQTGPVVGRALELTQGRLDSEGSAEQVRLLGGIRLVEVTFRYGAETRPALDDISLSIEPGELVAIAGPSGSGKSTILRLLLGFEEPEQGSVLYDDHPLGSLDLGAVRRQLGVVLQDGQLLPGTIHDNLGGVASLSESEAWELAEIVALADDIRAMPMKLATVVTLNGGAFSGGQRQRLLIARALAARPRILLLDEATSALDNITQRVITDNLAQLGMTRVVVAHRLSTMAGADRILVVDNGRLVESGTYEDLMAERGRFHALASRQVL